MCTIAIACAGLGADLLFQPVLPVNVHFRVGFLVYGVVACLQASSGCASVVGGPAMFGLLLVQGTPTITVVRRRQVGG